MCDQESSSIFPSHNVGSEASDIYILLDEIPSQGFNRLTKAIRWGKYYMLKSLKPEYMGDPYYEGLLRKEFEISIRMDHPSIVQTIAFEKVEGLGMCIVTSFIDGRTLDVFVQEKPSFRERKRVARQLLEAMSYYHQLQIVHRDIKPANILITQNGSNVRLIDFGLSDKDEYAILKDPAYTREYASPEQLERQPLDCRSDIYSFGRVLKYMFPHAFPRVIRKCTMPSRSKRYSSAEAVMQDMFSSGRKIAKALLLLLVVVGIPYLVHTVTHLNYSGYHAELGNGYYLNCDIVEGEAHVVKGSKVRGRLEIPTSIHVGPFSYPIVSIGEEAFVHNKDITQILLPEGLREIQAYAFFECNALSDTLILPQSLQLLGHDAFCATRISCLIVRSINCRRFDKVEPPHFFFNCAHMEEIVVEPSVDTLCPVLFADIWPKRLQLPDNLTILTNSLLACVGGIDTFMAPKHISLVDVSAFWSTRFRHIVFGDELETINGFAFRWSDQCEYLEIGRSIKYIGSAAMADLKSLKTLVIRAPEPPELGPLPFQGTPIENAVLKVPASSVDKYRESDFFKEFGRIEPLED